jgi:hypothetical protein
VFRHFEVMTLSIACIAVLPGCAMSETRPGNPDSYNTGLSGGRYYASEWKHLEWPTSFASSDADETAQKENIRTLQSKTVPIHDPPPAYLASNVPREIWQARGAAWNMHLKYLAASYKAQSRQDSIAVPLFGLAIATAALGVAKASTVSVAATALGGTSLYAGYDYLHPDKDMSTDQTAATALQSTLDSPSTNDLQKVIRITSDANEDLAVIDYQGIAANIQTCQAGQAINPVSASPSNVAAPGHNSGS